MYTVTAAIEDPPAYLPPRRPSSSPNLNSSHTSWHVPLDRSPLSPRDSPSPFLPPGEPSSTTATPASLKEQPVAVPRPNSRTLDQHGESRPTSFQSFSSSETYAVTDISLQRTLSNGSDYKRDSLPKIGTVSPTQTPRLKPTKDGVPLSTALIEPVARWPSARTSTLRRSLLRFENRLTEDGNHLPVLPPPALVLSESDPQMVLGQSRPVTQPSTAIERRRPVEQLSMVDSTYLSHPKDDLWQLPPLPPSRTSTPGSLNLLGPKPRPSFARLSSLDSLMAYRDEMAEWKRVSASSSVADRSLSEPVIEDVDHARSKPCSILDDASVMNDDEHLASGPPAILLEPQDDHPPAPRSHRNKFRHIVGEIGFCFTIAMTQFLAEYLISGFAIELPNLLSGHLSVGTGSMGLFWPASLLSLILSATLFIFARLADMYSGYCIFMFGVAWLAIWTLIPGFCRTEIWLDVSRAMQGLAIAASMPSTFTMVGSIYPEGPRRNFVMGLYSGCAPLGFFAGFLCAGALPRDKPQWYFFIASALAATTFVTAFLSVPSDRTDRRKLGLKMDWIGAFLIMAGLILVSYALSAEPYASHFKTKSGFAYPIVYAPFASGIACLIVAFWYEGWCATCPLLPFDFFKPKSVKAFSLACLCFYASYGVWLYNSAQFFQSPTGVTKAGEAGMTGLTLALWYTPTAVGGVILCIVGGSLMHIVPIMVLLLISALAWVGAPLLLALAPLPLEYWSYVVPSMLCATIGIDLTFTISIVFFSSVQPLRYQGLSGAVCSSLVNLAMSFALSISEIVMKSAYSKAATPEKAINWGFRATFIYAAASAGLGLVICAVFVRLSRSVVQEQKADVERPRASSTSSDSTLIDRRVTGLRDTDAVQ